MNGNMVVAALIAVSAGWMSPAVAMQRVSYTEPHEKGSILSFGQDVWDCGGASGRIVVRAMGRMVRNPDRQAQIASAAGCSRKPSADVVGRPWHVIGHLGTACRRRVVETETTAMPDGRVSVRRHAFCGVEGHALIVERDGERRTAIDVLDIDSYD